MDYGEKTRLDDPRNNLNLENWAPEHDPKNIGGQAIFSSELDEVNAPEGDLGQIIDLAPPPVPVQVEKTDEPAETTKDLKPIVGTHFSDTVTTEINRAENELGQTGNINNFYDEIRDMAEIAKESWTEE